MIAPEAEGLKVQSCALVQHVQGPGQQRDGGLHREPVRGLAPGTKTSFTGRPTTQQGGAGHRDWQAAGHHSSVQDQILAQQYNVNPLFYILTSLILRVLGSFFHQSLDFMIFATVLLL